MADEPVEIDRLEQPNSATARAVDRAKGELSRARDIRLSVGGSLLIGLLVGWLAVFLKATLNELVGGETGNVLLLAAAVIAAWFGGVIGGVTATLVALVMNGLIFLSWGQGIAVDRVQQAQLALYLVVGMATVLLVASRRASRDRLEDVTDEVATLAAQIEARDARIEVMLAASRTGFWEWDIRSGQLTWSDTTFEQAGIEPSEEAPTFERYLETIHPDDRADFRHTIDAALESGVDFSHEFRVVWPDGSVHWTHGAGRVFRDERGQPIRMLGTGQDISERRRIQDDRDRLLAEERSAGEFREALIDVISHELRTPITTILGLAQILTRPGRPDDAESRAAMLKDVRSESERLHRLVEDLLVLSRVERGRLQVVDPEPIQLRRLLDRIVADEAPELVTLRIEARLEPDLPVVAGEATYVEQTIRNLLGNAAKYTPVGTHVVVDARREHDAVAIRVMDDGPGIQEESVDRLFELFYRDPDSARAVSGSGIGLFVCASLVEAMGGRMWAKRRPEGGSEFGFTLNVIEADEADTADTTATLLAARRES